MYGYANSMRGKIHCIYMRFIVFDFLLKEISPSTPRDMQPIICLTLRIREHANCFAGFALRGMRTGRLIRCMA